MGKIKKSKSKKENVVAKISGGVKKSKNSTPSADSKKVLKSVPRGKPKSGRTWKPVNVLRSSSIKKFKRDTTEKKQKQRDEDKKVKELSQSLKNAKKIEIEARKLRVAENKRKKEENTKKSEIVQVIKNPAKLKRMKKKQLRKIEKRDTTAMSKK